VANRQSGGEDECYRHREKFWNFIAWVEPDPKNSIFHIFKGTLQFYPKPMVPMESRDSEGVPFANLESL